MSDEWMPIETAPKDRMILGCDPDRYYYAIVHFVDPEWACVDYRGMGMGIGFYPTLWHPLPNPPVSPAKEGSQP